MTNYSLSLSLSLSYSKRMQIAVSEKLNNFRFYQIYIKIIDVYGTVENQKKMPCPGRRLVLSWSPEAAPAGSAHAHPSSSPCARVEQDGEYSAPAGRVTRPAISSRDPLRSAATNARPRPSRPSVRPPAAASRRRHPHPRHPLAPRAPVPSRRAPSAMTRRAAGCRRVSCLPAAMASWRGSRRPR